jgi:DNA-binding NarL/FixJ family response regulator
MGDLLPLRSKVLLIELVLAIALSSAVVAFSGGITPQSYENAILAAAIFLAPLEFLRQSGVLQKMVELLRERRQQNEWAKRQAPRGEPDSDAEGSTGLVREVVGVEDPTPTRPARLLIADAHALFRKGLRTMLSGEDGLQVIAEASDGAEALSYCRELRPDLVLMDVKMPVMGGLEVTRKIKEEMPQTSVVIVTMHENPDYLFEAIKAGAAGYVLKDASRERLLEAVRSTLDGESPLNQELAMRLLVRLAREARAEDPAHSDADAPVDSAPARSEPATSHGGRRAEKQLESLTPREVEVLKLLSQGQTTLQIAQNLMVSGGAAKIHVQHIISKLGVSDRTQAAVRAIRAGVIESR